MNLRKGFVILLCSLSITCFSCGNDDFFEEEIIYKNDSIIYTNDSVNPPNNGTPGDTTLTDTTRTDTTINSPNTKTDYYYIETITKYMNQSSGGVSVQGAACHGDYLFQFQDKNAAVFIYNLKQKKFVKKITLTPNKYNHCNQASFSDKYYSTEDMFPLLYVSGSSSGTYNHVQVYRITGYEDNFEIKQIQEIILPPSNKETWVYWTCIIMDNDNHALYAYANSNTRLIKFDIPDIYLDTVNLTDYDIKEIIDLDFIDHQQGGIIRNNILYIIFGVPAWGDKVTLRIFNIYKKIEMAKLNLTDLNFKKEPEALFFYNNDIYCATNNAGIYKILLKNY